MSISANAFGKVALSANTITDLRKGKKKRQRYAIERIGADGADAEHAMIIVVDPGNSLTGNLLGETHGF